MRNLSLADAGDRLFTRCERETFIRLPRTQAVLFTIRTLVKPLRVFQGRPELGPAVRGGPRRPTPRDRRVQDDGAHQGLGTRVPMSVYRTG